MRRQLVPGPVVRLTVIKAKTRPGIEASIKLAGGLIYYNYLLILRVHDSLIVHVL